MDTIKLSPKYQVVIPKKVRESLQLEPGQELQIYVLDGSIRIHPRKSLQSLYGIAKGMEWKDIYRDHTDRF